MRRRGSCQGAAFLHFCQKPMYRKPKECEQENHFNNNAIKSKEAFSLERIRQAADQKKKRGMGAQRSSDEVVDMVISSTAVANSLLLNLVPFCEFVPRIFMWVDLWVSLHYYSAFYCHARKNFFENGMERTYTSHFKDFRKQKKNNLFLKILKVDMTSW